MRLSLPFKLRASATTPDVPPEDEPPVRLDRQVASVRRLRLQAAAPRLAVYVLIAILCLAGLRAIAAPAPAAAPPAPPPAGADLEAQGFAESFAHVYLTWSDHDVEARERLLAPFLPDAGDPSAGFEPGEGTAQEVFWTSVAGIRQLGDRALVTVAAQTSAGLVHLVVPVARDPGDLLYVSGYPAFVGPPATAAAPELPSEEVVSDGALVKVVERALVNYLTRDQENLRADLAPGAVVSLPQRPLRAVEPGEVTWLEPGHRVAAEVSVEDARDSTWTLRYELDVEQSDRWYVRSIQINPPGHNGGV